MATKRARESSAAEANGNPSDGAVMSPAEKKVRAEVGAEAAAAVATGAGSRRFSLAREPDTNRYMAGFGNEFQSEALPDSLPVGQNTPQVCPRNLFAEQLSGTSFTTPRDRNERTWFYRIHPSVGHRPFVPAPTSPDFVSDFSQCVGDPNQTRWTPFPLPAEGSSVTFAEGLRTVCGSGSAESKSGLAVHVYTCNAPMVDQAICNSDGDFLVVPQLGLLDVRTEMGLMRVQPGEIFVVPRGIKFSVAVTGPSRGYVLECFSGHYRIPDLGPIGANGLANPRDFLTPVAAFEDRRCEFTVLQKYLGRYWAARYDRSPFDVVAWFGNYVPYKYDLSRFVVINSVSVDHLDPSIFTVLTCPTNEPGVACADFVIFPPRWAVQEGTFRPPYYHRNCMAEFMGNILGKYDAKPNGFLPGSATLHSCMIPHGPDRDAFSHGSSAALAPTHMEGGLAFMFETTYMMRLTKWALSTNVDKDYYKCWEGLEVKFDGKN